jgi:hypothetical protein
MAILNITIQNTDVDLLAKSLNYQATINGEPNPETKGAFCKAWIVGLAKERIRNQKRQDALEAANILEADIS